MKKAISLLKQDVDKSLVRVWDVNLKNGAKIKVATIEQDPRKPSMCEGCPAPCCQGLFKPILTSEEFLSRKFKFTYTPLPVWLKKQGIKAKHIATLDINNDPCLYFDAKTARCSIWPDCPKSCLAYDCREDERPEIKEFAKRRRREWQEQ